jgi:uncharacterized protein (DUF58 family)
MKARVFLLVLLLLLLLLLVVMLLLLLLLLVTPLWAAAAVCQCLKPVRSAGDAAVVVDLSRNVKARARAKMAGNAERVAAVPVVVVAALGADRLLVTASIKINTN